MYKLCRTNKTTLARHAKRRHNDNLSEVVVRPYSESSETVRKARERCEKANIADVETVVRPSSLDAASGMSDVELFPDEFGEKSTKTGQTVDPPVPAKKQIEKVQTTLSFEDQAARDQPVDTLHSKIDTLINEFKELKLQVKSATKIKKPGLKPLMAVDGKSLEETAKLLLHWPEVKKHP